MSKSKQLIQVIIGLSLMMVITACGSEAAAPNEPVPGAAEHKPATTTDTTIPAQPAEKPAAVAPPAGNPDNATPPQNAQPVPYDPTGLPFGINSTQTPAPLVLSDFKVDPPGMMLFQTSNISVVVTNKGTMPVSYAVTLRIRTASGTSRAMIRPGETQQVDLEGGESKTVSFAIGGIGNGTHIVYIDQVWDRLTVDSQI